MTRRRHGWRDGYKLESEIDGLLRTVSRDVEAYAAPCVDRLIVGTTSTDLNEQLRQLEAFATLHGLRR